MELYFGNIYQRYEYHVNCRGTESGKGRELLDLRIKDGGVRWKLNLITHEKNLLEIKTAICFWLLFPAVARSVVSTDVPVDWHEAGAEKMPLPDEAYEVILCQFSLQFVEDKLAAMNEMYQGFGKSRKNLH